MSEQKVVQPTSGAATADRAMLSWSVKDGSLSYKITVEVLNACYSEGPVTVEDTNGQITVNATVDYEKAICAQVMQEVTFEGSHDVTAEGFSVKATVFDTRSGRTTVLE